MTKKNVADSLSKLLELPVVDDDDYVTNPSIELLEIQDWDEKLMINHTNPDMWCVKCERRLVFYSYKSDYDGYGRCGGHRIIRCAFKDCGHRESTNTW